MRLTENEARDLARQTGVELPVKKRSKYGAVPIVVDGIRFDSTREARRYGELLLLRAAGEIRDLAVHPTFAYFDSDNDQVLFTYEADFEYFSRLRASWVVEDVKGVRTAVFNLKKKLIEDRYGITIVLV